MIHAVRGFEIIWKHLPSSEVLYNDIENKEGTIREQTPLAESGLCPCLFVNIGSAMTIVGVSFISIRDRPDRDPMASHVRIGNNSPISTTTLLNVGDRDTGLPDLVFVQTIMRMLVWMKFSEFSHWHQ